MKPLWTSAVDDHQTHTAAWQRCCRGSTSMQRMWQVGTRIK